MTDYTEGQRERLVVAEERKAAALESIALQMPDLIAKMGYRSSYSKRDNGTDHGLYRTTPPLDGMTKGDKFQVPISGYWYDTNWKTVKFCSPFNFYGEITGKLGEQVASANPAKDYWEKNLKLGSWQYDQSGQAHSFPLRIAHMVVGASKDNPDKKFAFIGRLEDRGITDPMALEYKDIPKPAAPTLEQRQQEASETPF